MAQCQAPHSDSRTFIGLLLYLAGRCCKYPQSARGPTQCKSGPEKACLVNVTIYCTVPFFNNDSPPPRQFLRKKYFEKKLGKMLILQIIQFHLRGPGPPGRTYTPITG